MTGCCCAADFTFLTKVIGFYNILTAAGSFICGMSVCGILQAISAILCLVVFKKPESLDLRQAIILYYSISAVFIIIFYLERLTTFESDESEEMFDYYFWYFTVLGEIYLPANIVCTWVLYLGCKEREKSQKKS